jgi:hypothetical protein
MRYMFALLCVCALRVVPLVGCSEPTRDGGSEPCQAPLSDYCEGSECPTWDEAVANAEECFPEYFEVRLAQYGPCGDLKYVEAWGWFWEINDYFDASGALVATYIGADTPIYCDDTSSDIWYGPIPDCTHGTPWESFCEFWGGAASETE